jgi:translation initiation factor IF-2
VAATKVKVIDLAKELGVTSKDLMLAAEEMGHKGVRAMTPLDAKLANDLRTKLGKGRDLPEEPVKPKRVPKPKAPAELGPDGMPIKKPARAKKAKPADAEEETAIEVKPAATIVKPKPAEVAGQPPTIMPKPTEIAPEPPRVAPVTPPPPVEPVKPAAAAPPAAARPGAAARKDRPRRRLRRGR